MRFSHTTAAGRLQSVAQRYCNPHVWLAYSESASRFRYASGGERGRDDSSGLARLEAVLFLAREPLSIRKLGQLADLADGTAARTLVRELNRQYDASGRAFRVEGIAGGYQLLSRPQFAPWLRQLGHVPPELRLSAPAMETLGVVAYRQPVLRADVEAIRGVSCGEILRQLMDRDLVRIGGRSDELGRPYLYGTTTKFLQTFGLRSLDQLPRADTLRCASGLESSDDIHQSSNVHSSKESLIEKEDQVTVSIGENPQLDQEHDEDRASQNQPVAAIDDGDDFDYEDDVDDDVDDDEEDDDDFDEDFDDSYDEDFDDEWEEVGDDEDDVDEEEDDWEEDDDWE